MISHQGHAHYRQKRILPVQVMRRNEYKSWSNTMVNENYLGYLELVCDLNKLHITKESWTWF